MTLTVPKAGSVAGAVADIRVPVPTMGDDIAQFGRVINQVGTKMMRDQDAQTLARAQLDYTRQLNDLDLELRNSGDAAAIDGFSEREAALRASVLEGLPDTVREEADLRFATTSEGRRFSLGQQAVNLRQSESRVLVSGLQSEVVRGSVGLDPDARLDQLEAFAASVQGFVDAGIYTPEQGLALVRDTQGAMETATATAFQRDDPQALIAMLESGDLFGEDEEKRQSWITRAQAEIVAREAANDRAATEQAKLIGARLSDATKILRAGQMPTDLDELIGLAELHENGDEFGLALMLVEQRPDFMRAPPSVQRTMLAEEEARPKASSDELDISKTMREALEENEKAWKEDPIAHAQNIGLGEISELPEDLSGMTAPEIAQSLFRRGAFSDSLTGEGDRPGWVDDAPLFTKAERERFTELAGQDMPPPERAKLAEAFALAFGDDAPRRIAEVSDDPLFDYVGGLLSNGGNPKLARDVFAGQRAIASKDVPLPEVPQRRQTWFVEFQGLFDDDFEAGARDSVIAAADALYASRARGNPDRSDGRISETEYLQAVHEVLGGTGKYGGGGLFGEAARGGVQEINGLPTLVPPGVAGRDIERAWSELGRELSFGTIASAEVADIGAATSDTLRALSVSGAAPQFGGQPMDANTWANTGLRALRDGTYALIYTHPTLGQTVAMDENGDVFELDLRKLLERGAQ